MLQEQIIYVPAHITRRTETPVEALVKSKRKTIHITTKTVKNKLLGVSLIALGILSAKLTGDGTAMMMTFFIGLSAIIAK